MTELYTVVETDLPNSVYPGEPKMHQGDAEKESEKAFKEAGIQGLGPAPREPNFDSQPGIWEPWGQSRG